MQSNAGMANRQDDADLRFAQVSALSTLAWLARLVQRGSTKFDEKRLTEAVFLDVAKAFDTVWDDGLLYKLTIK